MASSPVKFRVRLMSGRAGKRFLWALLLFGALSFLAFELRTSWLQAKVFAAVARRADFAVARGSVEYPAIPQGPYDYRLGYARMAEFARRLEGAGYRVESQARPSLWMRRLTGWGLFPVYREKSQAGLSILDWRARPLSETLYPGRVYRDFDSVPRLVIESLLFVENREMLDPSSPTRNPAVEWNRLMRAFVELGLRRLDSSSRPSGGSTLATQLEKIRHSPEGRTATAGEKLRQMLSASLRAYHEGELTLESRRRIATEYINSLPLASLAGYGEVLGLADGLWAWFDQDVARANYLLAADERTLPEAERDERAAVYRRALSLLLAVNRPSHYLQRARPQLEARVDAYLRMLADAGIISADLRDRALRVRLAFRDQAPETPLPDLADRKGIDAVRGTLLGLLGIDSTYQLDRLDLEVTASLDRATSEAVSRILRQLNDPVYAARAGVVGHQMLAPDAAEGVIYSFVLYEAGDGVNWLRIQADNLNQPLNINQQTRLELGSTAKLRTLATYLEIIAGLHGEWSGKPPAEREAALAAGPDPLTRWTLEYLQSGADTSLAGVLDAAVRRRYPASPHEAFFTGGGLHVFANFDGRDNGQMLSVREALERSTNLVFIRLMRDIVAYFQQRLPGYSPDLLSNPAHPARADYLRRFADREGKEFLTRFYRRYRGLSPDESLARLARRVTPTPPRLAVAYRSVRPEDDLEAFESFLEQHLAQGRPLPVSYEALYRKYDPDRFDWNDRGYLARVHPLELWLLHFLQKQPQATLEEVFAASAAERQQVYRWLSSPRRVQAQNLRIRTLLELDAFGLIQQVWKRHGFPFPAMAPSLASAIGSSGDNPAALAELMGLVVNGGVRYPAQRIEKLHFARGTPVETVFHRRPAEGERVFPAAVAAVLKEALRGVVEKGTARRAFGALTLADGTQLAIGGKTGTGDNRFETYGANGWVIDSRVRNRTAAFVFWIGDRFYGTITAYVPGEKAAAHRFTSALPVQIFRHLAPELRPLMDPGPPAAIASAP